jgi:hypothetical protein
MQIFDLRFVLRISIQIMVHFEHQQRLFRAQWFLYFSIGSFFYYHKPQIKQVDNNILLLCSSHVIRFRLIYANDYVCSYNYKINLSL